MEEIKGREKQIIDERLRKVNELRKNKIEPYPSKSWKEQTCAECIDSKLGKKVKTAGRIISKRDLGKIAFARLIDGTGEIQIVLQEGETKEKSRELFKKYIDAGDFVDVSGKVFETKTKEKSILVEEIKIITKSIKPLPEKFHGLKDEEEKFRKRYLDILMNKDVREMILKKAEFWNVVRDFMKKKGFVEVETPTIEVTTGGAEARPFKSYHNDFDIDVYFRICIGELWQKRLMAAGFEKTFEIGRAYRNEGSSQEHVQEFTNMEFYWAYADYKDGMELVKELYRKIAKDVFGTTKFTSREYEFDLAKDWKEIDYASEIKKQTGIDIFTANEKIIKSKLEELEVKYDGSGKEKMIDAIWKYCRKNIAGPAFLINVPKAISPLAKENPDRKEVTQRFQPIIAGAEVGNGYSELNDPIDQRKRFEEQQKLAEKGDQEAMMAEWDFVEMLEYGMPPTCGFGFGERLFAILVDKPLRETQIFPLMRPEGLKKKENEKKRGK